MAVTGRLGHRRRRRNRDWRHVLLGWSRRELHGHRVSVPCGRGRRGGLLRRRRPRKRLLGFRLHEQRHGRCGRWRWWWRRQQRSCQLWYRLRCGRRRRGPQWGWRQRHRRSLRLQLRRMGISRRRGFWRHRRVGRRWSFGQWWRRRAVRRRRRLRTGRRRSGPRDLGLRTVVPDQRHVRTRSSHRDANESDPTDDVNLESQYRRSKLAVPSGRPSSLALSATVTAGIHVRRVGCKRSHRSRKGVSPSGQQPLSILSEEEVVVGSDHETAPRFERLARHRVGLYSRFDSNEFAPRREWACSPRGASSRLLPAIVDGHAIVALTDARRRLCSARSRGTRSARASSWSPRMRQLRRQDFVLRCQVRRPHFRAGKRVTLVLLARLARGWRPALLLVQPGQSTRDASGR